MPPRRTKKDAQSDLDLDMRRSKLTLFIQQFEKEAQERMNELEAKLENTLATVDKVFKVELMKMPPSLKNTLMGDLLSGETLPCYALSLEIQQPLRRMPSKRGARLCCFYPQLNSCLKVQWKIIASEAFVLFNLQ
uniref:Borealin N-terminal domain-containing protein n=1 Tax=Sphaeramia orbicularis TaxID=375764 RepID=A0A673APM6_9TELE